MPSASSTPSGIRLSVSPSTASKEVFVVRVDGSVDTLTADELDHVIGTLVRQKRTRLVIDLAGTQYISSAGWGIFISRLREAREDGGDLKLARMTEPVRDVYDLLELHGVLHHFERLDAAEADFNGAHGPGSAPVPRVRAAPEQSSPVPSPVPSTLEEALLQLIGEDPFYSIRELRHRLGEIGTFKVGRWGILRALRKLGLTFRHQRFRYYRLHMHGLKTSR